jgi:drug/metabolite transporter (DMT)-like permease
VTSTANTASAAQHSNLRGIALFLLGISAFVGNDSITKLLGSELPPGELIAVRGVIVSVYILAAGLWTGAFHVAPKTLFTRPFLLRPIADLAATLTFVSSLMHMRFADAIGIQQLQPLVITAASGLWLGEHVGWRRWTATLVGLVGALLILKPGSGTFEPFAILAVICVLFAACSDLATRVISKGTPLFALALPSSVVVTLGGMVLGRFEHWVAPTPAQWLALVATSSLIFGGLILVITAIRSAELSVLAPLRYTSVILAVLLQITLWGVVPDASTTAGLVLIVSAGLYIIHRERLRSLGRA